MKNKARVFAERGHHYAYVLTKQGWRNQGMVPDNNRAPFVAEYKAKIGSRVAFVPWCYAKSPNVLSDSEIYSFASHSE